MPTEVARFEVTGHYELSERGAFLIGHIRTGTFRNGMLIDAAGHKERFTISGIEFLDNIAEQKHWNALVFRERPNLEALQRLFPVGSIVVASPAPI